MMMKIKDVELTARNLVTYSAHLQPVLFIPAGCIDWRDPAVFSNFRLLKGTRLTIKFSSYDGSDELTLCPSDDL